MSAQPLIDYLKQLESKGQTHIALEPKAREILRLFYVKAVKGAFPKVELEQASNSTPVAQKVSTMVSSAPVVASSNLEQLKDQCTNYRPLLDLGTLRKTLVFPSTSATNSILFVGAAPGYQDEKAKRPFSGVTGEKLDGILRAMGLTREQVHVTNILKWRPDSPNQTTNTRSPSTNELSLAKSLFDQEVSLIKPKLIITLGEGTAQFLLASDASIDSMRGQSYTYNGILTIPTYHPSLLIHTQDTKDKRSLWEDMLKAMEHLQMPISEKQQSYFLPKS